MKRKKKNQIPGINIEDTESNESEGLKTEKKKKRFGRKKQNDQIVRIEELEKMMEKYGDDIDPEDIVSMYIPHRRRKKIGADHSVQPALFPDLRSTQKRCDCRGDS